DYVIEGKPMFEEADCITLNEELGRAFDMFKNAHEDIYGYCLTRLNELPFAKGIVWYTPDTITQLQDGNGIPVKEMYDEFDVKRYAVCPLTGWAFIEMQDGQFFG